MKALVIGAARSGIGVSTFLNKLGYEVFLTDAKEIENQKELEEMGIHCYPNGHPDSLKEQDYDCIVKNPGIPYSVPFVDYFVKKGYFLLNEIDVACKYAENLRIAAITGTNGKTTTTTLLGKILSANDPASITAGNIGTSLCAMIQDDIHAKHDVALEIGAFQLLGFDVFHPHVATIMNLTPDHLDYFGDLDAYYRSKILIYKNMTQDDYFLLNDDDEVVKEYCQSIPCQVITYSLERQDTDIYAKEGKVYYHDQVLFSLDHLHLPGKHNLQNAMVASALAYFMDVDPKLIDEEINTFQGVEHRIEYVDTIDGVKYYNDSKGTNTDATIVALKAFDTPIHLLAGGYDKHLSFEPLKPYLSKLKGMYVFGETKEKLKELYPDAKVFETMEQALKAAYQEAKEGEVVLLSPACASWDQYPNFEVRGEEFKELVHQLKQ